MSSLLISYGKGLGDHLRFSAIVREHAATHEAVSLFCTDELLEQITFLYRDLPNVQLIRANTEADRVTKTNILDLHPLEESGIAVERACYAIAKVPFEKRWSAFKLKRDLAREEACTRALMPNGPYQFVHDDARYSIDPVKLNPLLPIVRPDPAKPFMIFDYLGLIERAKEVHVIESSFLFLVDQVAYEAPDQQLTSHRYARPLRPFYLPILKKAWHIL